MVSTTQPEAAEVTRLKTGGLVVEIARPDYRAYRWASGANISRILQRLDSSVDFLIVTSFRAFDKTDGVEVPRSKSKNEDIFTELPRELRSELGTKRIGAYWLVGHWTEKTPDGSIVDSLEYSWFLTKDDPAIPSEQWLAAGVRLAQKYDQDGFITRLDGEMTLRTKDGAVKDHLTTAGAVESAWANLAKLRESGQQHGYTEVRKLREPQHPRPMLSPAVQSEDKTSSYRVIGDGQSYAPEFFVAEPHNNSGRAYFHALGAQYRLPEP